MFHKWRLVRVEPYTYENFADEFDIFSFKLKTFKATRLFYVCGHKNCHKTKIIQKDGHWTKEELDGTI